MLIKSNCLINYINFENIAIRILIAKFFSAKASFVDEGRNCSSKPFPHYIKVFTEKNIFMCLLAEWMKEQIGVTFGLLLTKIFSSNKKDVDLNKILLLSPIRQNTHIPFKVGGSRQMLIQWQIKATSCCCCFFHQDKPRVFFNENQYNQVHSFFPNHWLWNCTQNLIVFLFECLFWGRIDLVSEPHRLF